MENEGEVWLGKVSQAKFQLFLRAKEVCVVAQVEAVGKERESKFSLGFL